MRRSVWEDGSRLRKLALETNRFIRSGCVTAPIARVLPGQASQAFAGRARILSLLTRRFPAFLIARLLVGVRHPPTLPDASPDGMERNLIRPRSRRRRETARACRDRVRQRRVGCVVRQVLLAREEPHERPALERHRDRESCPAASDSDARSRRARALRHGAGTSTVHFVADSARASAGARQDDADTSQCTLRKSDTRYRLSASALPPRAPPADRATIGAPGVAGVGDA